VRVGGEFLYNPNSADQHRDLLLIAGGVGINPLLSIATVRVEEINSKSTSSSSSFASCSSRFPRTTLLYSARSLDELLFRQEIEALSRNAPQSFNYHMTITGAANPTNSNISNVSNSVGVNTPSAFLSSSLTFGRFSDSLISRCLSDSCIVYLCGPTSLLDEWGERLQKLGVPKEDIRTERW